MIATILMPNNWLEKYFSAIFCFCVCAFPLLSQATQVDVVEIKSYSFTGDSFLGLRKEEKYREHSAREKYFSWASDAIQKVNQYLPKEDRLDKVKLKLIFSAKIKTSKSTIMVPISNIESYQEPKTNSIRLGMLELRDSRESFQLTVAHEYAHLVFENAARKSGVVSKDKDNLEFWSKGIYEGTADYLMAIAFSTNRTASESDWSVRHLDEFKTIADARSAPNNTIAKASKFFQSQNLVPQFSIYSDWLEKVGKFIQTSGQVDPYAEGGWVAGSLLKLGTSSSEKNKVATNLLKMARIGTNYQDPQKFVEAVSKEVIKEAPRRLSY